MPTHGRELPAYQFGTIPAYDIGAEKVRKLQAAWSLLGEEYGVRTRIEYDSAVLFKDFGQYLLFGL